MNVALMDVIIGERGREQVISGIEHNDVDVQRRTRAH
jgi:hypothetical protein